MRLLKLIVSVMAILIIGGTVTLFVLLGERTTDGKSFRSGTIQVPPGASVVDSHVSGHLVVVRLALETGGTRLIFIDARTGLQEGSIELMHAR